MTRRELLTRAQQILSENKIPDASLEAEILLRHLLKIDRTQLFSEPDAAVPPELERMFRALIARRVKGEPTAYITGHREFYGLDFEVNPSVLIPRPETELLVEIALERAKKYASPLIADVGTGSGVIAITLALRLLKAKIYAIDTSENALDTARRNSRKHQVEKGITFLQGNLLTPLPQTVNIVVANLPYVRTADLAAVNTVGFEPELALDGGVDGLDRIRELCLQTTNKLLPGGCLLLEIGLGEKAPLVEFLNKNGLALDITFYKDLRGIERVIAVTLC